jgi:beta-galactosidase
MHGVNLHHGGGAVGSAVPKQVWKRRLEILKEMGCNAIRTAHNPPAPEFLDLCDELGFLVMDEIFDEWKIGKVRNGYNLYFDEWAEKDLTDFIHRDRNHPSVVMWSVGNEIREQPRQGGHEVLRELAEVIHREDPTRPFTLGCDNIAADGGSTTLEFLELLDIVGYNYVDRWHERRELFFSIDRHDHPDWKMVGTESANIYGSRGSYSLGQNPDIIQANYASGMIRVEQLWKFVRMHDYVIGDFMWTGIDYLGESRWPSRGAGSGVLDMCGFPKDSYYFYQSQWTDEPMIQIFPHWNWQGREGQFIPVLAYTNCDTVELYLNDKHINTKSLEFPRQGNSGGWNRYEIRKIRGTTADLHLSWDVPYEPGVLRAVGRKNGQIVCTKEVRTTGQASAIKLMADRDTISTGRDIAHVRVEIVDSEGLIVPGSNNLVNFNIEGQGQIIAVDSGNTRDLTSFQEKQRNVYNGLCLVIIESENQQGTIKLSAESEGLISATIEIQIQL